MRQINIFLALIVVLGSCNYLTKKKTNQKSLADYQQKAKFEKLVLDFNQPVLIDSSVYVMYPLTLEYSDEESSGFGSRSYTPTTYWNIVFYNTASGDYHLLNDTLKMVIYSYNPRNSDESASFSSSDFNKYLENGYNQVDKLLYYSITTCDYNNDGKINSEDPNYLFISDKAGKNFKQISPDHLNVLHWQTIKGTNKILFLAVKDINNDRKFDEKDETIPMVYDPNTNGLSKEIFTNEFKLKLKKQLDNQWIKNE